MSGDDGDRKRKRVGEAERSSVADEDEDSTELKIALLSSLHPDKQQEVLFDYLLAYDGSVEKASNAINGGLTATAQRKRSAVGYQSSLATFAGVRSAGRSDAASAAAAASLTKKGRTLHLFSPEDIEKHTPCSIIHSFLSARDADLLLKELLDEVPHYKKESFQMFERTVESPHSFGFYVDTPQEVKDQRDQYAYNGGYVASVRQTTPEMLRISSLVRDAVNEEISRRIRDHNPDQQKLKFQSPDTWQPNTSFVNCYDGGKESVGFHSDQLTYLGPRAVIGSLSLGVAREFRVRKIVPSDDPAAADTQGQIAIHLPHNSLLVMHADMQEEWKHCISPALTIDPHPVAGNKRLNVTYRCYRDYLHPRLTPRCSCGTPCVLRCVQKRKLTRGRYIWQCHAGYTPGQKSCSYFAWADFDEDGRPPWAKGYQGNANLPLEAQDDAQLAIEQPSHAS